MDPVLLFGITTNKPSLSCDLSTLAQAYKCIFRPENGCLSKKRKSRNDQCQTHYQQTKLSDLFL